MATIEQCREALTTLVGRLGGADPGAGAAGGLDRTISCAVPDLDVVFSGRLRDGGVQGLTTEPAGKAQIRLTVGSDDLLALAAGTLDFAGAWSQGRARVEAGVLDLLKLRTLL